MPNFKLEEKQLQTRLDKWLYFIKHLEDFQSIPVIIADDVFNKAFEKAELAKFGKEDLDHYENSLKVYRDLKGAMDTAFDEGKIEGKLEGILEGKLEGKLEGILEGKIEIAKSAKLMGLSKEDISKLTGLSFEEIEKI
jgi:predicted transposase/invertase (TIGR01784 family)